MRYYLGDTHFGHGLLVNDPEGLRKGFGGMRSFATTEEHDEHLISNINATVGRKDSLYILGDYCFPPTKAGHYRSRINCRTVTLIRGNHDTFAMEQHFSRVEDTLLIKIKRGPGIPSLKLFLSHYPHAFWPSSHRGSMHIYGHVHNKYEALLDKLFPGRRSTDVGADAIYARLGEYRPLAESEIVSFLMQRPGHEIIDSNTGRSSASLPTD